MSTIPPILLALLSGGGSSKAVKESLAGLERLVAMNNMRQALFHEQGVTLLADGVVDQYADETGTNAGTTTGVHVPDGDYYKNPASSVFLLQSNTTDESTDFTTSQKNEDVYGVAVGSGGAKHDDTTIMVNSTSSFNTGVITCPHNDLLNLAGDFSISLWAQIGTHNDLITWGDTTDGWVLNTAGEDFSFRVYKATVLTTVIIANTNVLRPLSASYHMVISREGDDWNLYVDGTRLFTATDAIVLPTVVSTNLVVDVATCFLEDIRIDTESAGIYTGASYTVPTVIEPAPVAADPNYVIESISFTANGDNNNHKLTFVHDPQEAVTLNTDIKGWVSRDGGTTYKQATLSLEDNAGESPQNVISNVVDMAGEPTGTAMRYKITIHNDKQQHVLATQFLWNMAF